MFRTGLRDKFQSVWFQVIWSSGFIMKTSIQVWTLETLPSLVSYVFIGVWEPGTQRHLEVFQVYQVRFPGSSSNISRGKAVCDTTSQKLRWPVRQQNTRGSVLEIFIIDMQKFSYSLGRHLSVTFFFLLFFWLFWIPYNSM